MLTIAPRLRGNDRDFLSCTEDNSLVRGNLSNVATASAKQKKMRPKAHYDDGGVDGARTRDPRRDRPVF